MGTIVHKVLDARYLLADEQLKDDIKQIERLECPLWLETSTIESNLSVKRSTTRKKETYRINRIFFPSILYIYSMPANHWKPWNKASIEPTGVAAISGCIYPNK